MIAAMTKDEFVSAFREINDGLIYVGNCDKYITYTSNETDKDFVRYEWKKTEDGNIETSCTSTWLDNNMVHLSLYENNRVIYEFNR